MTTVAPEAPASQKARSSLVISLEKAGIADADKQRHICAVWAGRPIGSRTELTEREARSLAARVKQLSRDELAAVLARPAPEPEPTPELPAGAIVCGPGPLTEHDAAQVRAFAEFLDKAGPPPSAEEIAAAVAVCPEDGAATCRASVAECCMTSPAPVVDQVEPPACPAEWCEDDACTAAHPEQPQHAEPEPAPSVEPVPEDVEEAAEAAVRRFRERIAAGIVWTAPDLSKIPPRVPLQLGPAPGRYCLARCYCGGCEGHAEQVAEAERAHARELRRALFGIDQNAARRR